MSRKHKYPNGKSKKPLQESCFRSKLLFASGLVYSAVEVGGSDSETLEGSLRVSAVEDFGC